MNGIVTVTEDANRETNGGEKEYCKEHRGSLS